MPLTLRSVEGRIQRRAFATELRATSRGDKPIIEGHAAVFEQLSEPIYDWFGFGYREKVQAGAFADTIQADDIRALFNHDPNFVLGRNRAGTLRLSEDSQGLAFEVDPPDTQIARDLRVSIERGDISQCSFGFYPIKDHWETTNDYKDQESQDVRTLLQVQLFDVSPVTYPAYPQTDVNARSLVDVDLDALQHILFRAERGASLRSSEVALVEDAITRLQKFLPKRQGASPVEVTQHVQPASAQGSAGIADVLQRIEAAASRQI